MTCLTLLTVTCVVYEDENPEYLESLLLGIGSGPSISVTCNYSISLYDSYGDGWHGNNYVNLYINDSLYSSYTLSSGSGPATYTFPVDDGNSVYTTFTAGNYTSECFYYIYDSDDNQVTSDGVGNVTPTGVYFTASCDGGEALYCNYDETSTEYWYSIDTSTNHYLYPDVSNNCTGTLIITIDGDYDSSSEYADIYVDGSYFDSINPSQNGPTTQEFSISQSNFTDGNVLVTVDNSSDVDTGYGNDLHTVQLIFQP